MNQKLIIHVKAMAEIYGKTMTDAAAMMFLAALSKIPEPALMAALERCLKELRTFPTVADVLARAQALDGRPGPEEAWAMLPKSERDSVVWTEEMAAAYGACSSLIGEDDIAARMTFREVYVRRVQEARDAGVPAKWTASLGHSKGGRQAVLEEAARLGRLPMDQVRALLPEPDTMSPSVAALVSKSVKTI